MSPENKECFLRERKWQYERKSTRTAYKKEALPFQRTATVLKIKADLWRIKKITLLNIKPYNLCKNSMWPTKAYIYLYIVHLKRIYNSYSQTKGKKKAPNKTSCLILQCRRFWVNDTSALSSEKNQEEGLLLEICTSTLKSNTCFLLQCELMYTQPSNWQ